MSITSPKPRPQTDYKIGDVVPMPERKLDIRPTAPLDNRPSFQPARGPKK